MNFDSERIPRSLSERSDDPVSAGLQGASIFSLVYYKQYNRPNEKTPLHRDKQAHFIDQYYNFAR
jgi:hypothetical protein